MAWNYQFIARLPEDFKEEDILFLRQLGIPNAYLALPRDQHDHQSLKRIKEQIEAGGIKFTYVHSNRFTFNSAIALGTENRERELEAYLEFLEIMASLGLNMIELNMMPFFVYSSNLTSYTRGAVTRTVDLQTILDSKTAPLARSAYIRKGQEEENLLLEQEYQRAAARGYTREELWENFAVFMARVLPTASKLGIRISLHPSDPPCVETVGGVPNLIRSFEDYKKAFRIADSDSLVMTFCCGCWLEGGERFGDIMEDARWALEHSKIATVHVRNITGPLPHFDETFLDNGFFDMYPFFELLRQYDYQGFINPDHHPIMVDGPIRRIPQGYAYGYMRALANCADEAARGGIF